MIEALFLRYYTPIDEEKLKDDMIEIKIAGGDENTGKTMKARKRLKDGSGYYKEKEEYTKE